MFVWFTMQVDVCICFCLFHSPALRYQAVCGIIFTNFVQIFWLLLSNSVQVNNIAFFWLAIDDVDDGDDGAVVCLDLCSYVLVVVLFTFPLPFGTCVNFTRLRTCPLFTTQFTLCLIPIVLYYWIMYVWW